MEKLIEREWWNREVWGILLNLWLRHCSGIENTERFTLKCCLNRYKTEISGFLGEKREPLSCCFAKENWDFGPKYQLFGGP